MTQPTKSVGPLFDLAAVDAELRQDASYAREGHTARTLVRETELRVVLVVMRAGARIAEHRAKDTASVQTLAGHVRLRLPDEIADLPVGRLLVLERGIAHDVEAVADSAFLLTLGWTPK